MRLSYIFVFLFLYLIHSQNNDRTFKLNILKQGNTTSLKQSTGGDYEFNSKEEIGEENERIMKQDSQEEYINLNTEGTIILHSRESKSRSFSIFIWCTLCCLFAIIITIVILEGL